MVTLETNRRDDGRLLLRLKGRFDPPSALQLIRRLESVGARRLIIDFSGCDSIEDASMSIVADLVRRHSGRVDLTGLRGHHVRLLAYLGAAVGGA
jgi:anti-anti-sigma regulatory factor